MEKKSFFLLWLLAISFLKLNAQPPTCFQNNIASRIGINAYWSMNGDGNDVIGTPNNPQGTIGTGVTFTGTAFTGSGGASFTGAGGIQYSDGTFMNTAFTNISFGAWIRPASITPGNHQIIFEEGGLSGITMYLNTNGEIVVVVSSGSQANSTDARFTFPTDGIYHHVAFTYENGLLQTFLDGLLQNVLQTGFGTIAAHTDAGGIGTTFGGFSSASTRFPTATFSAYQGLIDEVFYTRNAVPDGNILQYVQCIGRSNFTALPCGSDGFFVQGSNGDYNSINLVNGQLSASQGDGISGSGQNAIGFNALDGLIYGLDEANGKIFITQVTTNVSGYTYSSRYIGYSSLLEAAGGIIAGDVYGGRYYVRNGNTNTHYIIDVNPSSATYLQVLNTVVGPTTISIADWAYNPSDGQLYTINSANGNLYRINPNSGVATNLGGSVPSAFYGAMFFDNQGYLYVYNNTTGVIYRIDVSSGSYIGVAFASSTAGLSQNDGARCADAPLPIDFGDLPDGSTATAGAGTAAGQYQTMLSNNGARHYINSFVTLRMGATVTSENEGKPTAAATGDTDDGIASFPTIAGGKAHNIASYTVSANVTNAGTTAATLYGWIDWNSNGLFNTGERASVTVPAGFSGNVNLAWSGITLAGATGTTGVFARFRLSTDAAAAAPTGGAFDGEVEDYFIPFDTPLPVDFGNIEAIYKNGSLLVSWQTLKETENSYFEVQASKDGINFTTLGKVVSKALNGTSTDTLHYEFSTTATGTTLALGLGILLLGGSAVFARRRYPLLISGVIAVVFAVTLAGCSKQNDIADLENGDIYIRIAQVDKNGAATYSKAVKVVKE